MVTDNPHWYNFQQEILGRASERQWGQKKSKSCGAVILSDKILVTVVYFVYRIVAKNATARVSSMFHDKDGQIVQIKSIHLMRKKAEEGKMTNTTWTFWRSKPR
jgi:hypothetical protein